MATKIDDALEIIKGMTLLELRDLNKAIEEEFGITAADTNGSESSKAVGEVLFPPGSVGVVAQ